MARVQHVFERIDRREHHSSTPTASFCRPILSRQEKRFQTQSHQVTDQQTAPIRVFALFGFFKPIFPTQEYQQANREHKQHPQAHTAHKRQQLFWPRPAGGQQAPGKRNRCRNQAYSARYGGTEKPFLLPAQIAKPYDREPAGHIAENKRQQGSFHAWPCGGFGGLLRSIFFNKFSKCKNPPMNPTNTPTTPSQGSVPSQ